MPLLLTLIVLWLLLLTPWQGVVAGVILVPLAMWGVPKLVDRMPIRKWNP